MVDCRKKVENVLGSFQNEFIVIRDILLWKEPVYSFFVFCVLNLLGSCTTGFFRYNVCWFGIVLCVLVLGLFLSVLPEIKLDAAIQRGKTSAEERRRFEEITLSYRRFCSFITPVLKYAEPHWGELQKLSHTCLSYFLQLHFLISLPVGGLLVQLLATGIIHFFVVSLWIVSLCSLWMPWQYYGIQCIIYEILGVIPLPHPYICSDYLMNRCMGAKHCPMHHIKKPYQWIYYYRGKWWMVNEDDNEELEACFCDPDIKDERLDLQLDRVRFGIRTLYFVNFNAMTITGEVDLPIKRLSTKSKAELPGCLVATKWLWYWQNEHGNFEEYQLHSIDASQELEEQYLKGKTIFYFEVAIHKYKLYFEESPMYQKNRYYETKREVRRRPCFNNNEHASANSIIWKIMENKKDKQEDKHVYRRVKLKRYNTEYRDIKSLFMKTMHSHKTLTVQITIESIDRLENHSVWVKYSSTKSHMIYHGGPGDNVNERFLFHGTAKQSVDGICKKNFDWRMSGTSTGAIYGEGTYFATDSSTSHNYTSPDSKGYCYMFVALVLVGSYTQGKKGLRIPPKNPDNPRGDTFDSCVDNVKNPKIFVIFDKDQCYPAYLVKYKLNYSGI